MLSSQDSALRTQDSNPVRNVKKAQGMGTREQNTSKGEPASGSSSTSHGSGEPESVDLDDQDLAIDDDDALDLTEDGEDEYPGDRRRDPLRRP